MIKVYKSNIELFGTNEEHATISTEADYLELYDGADDFVASVRDNYPWITDKDAEDIRLAVALRF